MRSKNPAIALLTSILLVIVSFFITAFGQPAWLPALGIVASLIGFALFWHVLLGIPSAKKRFLLSAGWFACVQGVQLSWLLTHPYGYIYGLYLFLLTWFGIQFGLIGLLITPARVIQVRSLLGIAGLYTLFEWSRLFLFSGFPFNPIGLSITGSLWGLQAATLAGIYGLTFWVVFMNLLALRVSMLTRPVRAVFVWSLLALAPYLFGYFHLRHYNDSLAEAWDDPKRSLKTLLVQTAFPIEEGLGFTSLKQAVAYVEKEWDDILRTVSPYHHMNFDLLVLPEEVVPYGAHLALFPYKHAEQQFISYFGDKAKDAFPPLAPPLAIEVESKGEKRWKVCNAFYCQTLANLFNADLVAGMQDEQWIDPKNSQSYSSAFYFWPGGSAGLRYEKQVLLPVAENIPWECCKELAKDYGIQGSFTPGLGAKVFPGCKAPFGLSICYEEAFGNIMRDNRVKGAEFLVNVTSDVWYPNSRLPKQHFDHARLRTVENGMPLIRSCNTGITCAIDSLGRVIASLSEDMEWERSALSVQVPIFNYPTLYSKTGDWLVMGFSLMFLFLLFLPSKPLKPKPTLLDAEEDEEDKD